MSDHGPGVGSIQPGVQRFRTASLMELMVDVESGSVLSSGGLVYPGGPEVTCFKSIKAENG